ncbi:MAG: hypothetical protein GX974_03200, partial [Clostridiales bacterium]|nr:hypothetical protein [Clostridiales bacterium]
IYPDIDTAAENVKVEKVFSPRHENKRIYDILFRTYKLVYKDLRKLYQDVNTEREKLYMTGRQ